MCGWQDAVDMYSRADKWELVHRVAMTYMSEAEVTMLYIMQAQRAESAQKLKEAEKLYLMVKEPDLAINMYKKVPCTNSRACVSVRPCPAAAAAHRTGFRLSAFRQADRTLHQRVGSAPQACLFGSR